MRRPSAILIHSPSVPEVLTCLRTPTKAEDVDAIGSAADFRLAEVERENDCQQAPIAAGRLVPGR